MSFNERESYEIIDNSEFVYLSIIIPYHNEGVRLETLLQSIPNRKEIEILVIDDNSTECLDVFRVIQNKYTDSNVSFYANNTNEKYAGAARNIGINKARGEWILFADSDDCFLHGFYDIIEKYFDSEWDIVFFLPTSRKDNGEKGTRHLWLKELYEKYLDNPIRENKLRAMNASSPWSKLIRRKLIIDNDIFFSTTRKGNDILFSRKVAFFANDVLFVRDSIYCVTERKGNMTGDKSKQALYDYMAAWIETYDFAKKNYSKKDFQMLDMVGTPYVLRAKYDYGLSSVEQLKIILYFIKKRIQIFHGCRGMINITGSLLKKPWF